MVSFASIREGVWRLRGTYVVDELFYLAAKLIVIICAIDGREGLIQPFLRGASDIGDEIREILW